MVFNDFPCSSEPPSSPETFQFAHQGAGLCVVALRADHPVVLGIEVEVPAVPAHLVLVGVRDVDLNSVRAIPRYRQTEAWADEALKAGEKRSVALRLQDKSCGVRTTSLRLTILM